MEAPLVSCIVPAYNSARFISEAIDSILAQTYRPIEVIVVDDGSTDETPELVRGYGDPVRLVTQDDLGPAATRNRGITESTGDFLAFLDADDLWLSTKLECQMERFRARPELEISVTLVERFWPDGEAPKPQHWRLEAIPGFATTTLLARRSVFEKVGMLDTAFRYGDAVEWFMRARRMGLVEETLDEVLTLHREHGLNLTNRGADAATEEYLRIVHKYRTPTKDHES